MNIVFLTTVLPAARSTGGEVASQAVLDALRSSARVAVLGYARPGQPPPGHRDDHAAGVRPIETAAAGARPAGWMVSALARGLPYSAAKYVSRAYRSKARGLIEAQAPQLLVVDHAQAGWVRPWTWWDGPMVYLAHNAEQSMYAQAARRGRGARRPLLAREARRMRGLEGALADAADEVWALTAADAETLAPLSRVTPRVLSLPGLQVSADPLPEPQVDVAVLGQWTWAPNAAGLRWFLELVVPRLPASFQTVVGGAGAQHLAAEHPGVRFTGRVPDAMEFLRSARAVAVPSREGGGLQVKTLDAIASCRPVVATAFATRGIGPMPASVTVADSPTEFARALAECVADTGARARAPIEAGDWSRGRHTRLARELDDAIGRWTPG